MLTNAEQPPEFDIINTLEDFLEHDNECELLSEHSIEVYKVVEMIARIYVN